MVAVKEMVVAIQVHSVRKFLDHDGGVDMLIVMVPVVMVVMVVVMFSRGVAMQVQVVMSPNPPPPPPTPAENYSICIGRRD